MARSKGRKGAKSKKQKPRSNAKARNKGRKKGRFIPPSSGVLLGSVVDALQLRKTSVGQSSLTGSTPQRMFRGEWVKDESRATIIRTMGEAIVETGILVKDYEFGDGHRPVDLVELLLTFYAGQWDRLASTMRSFSCPVNDHHGAACSYLRLATIDLALRYAAVLLLANGPPPGTETPAWARPRGGGLLLREWLKRAGDAQPTREVMATRLGYSDKTIDDWLDGKTPPNEASIGDLATMFAILVGEDKEALATTLRRHYALTRISDELADEIGSETVGDLGKALYRYVTWIHEDLYPYFRLSPIIRVSEFGMEDLLHLLLSGTAAECAPRIVEKLWQQEPSPLWRTDLKAACADWKHRLQYVARTLASKEDIARQFRKEFHIPKKEAMRRAEMAVSMGIVDMSVNNMTEAAFERHGGEDAEWVTMVGDNHMKAENRMMQAEWASSRGDLRGAVVHQLRAVELHPDNAMAQFKCGAVLGRVAFEERPDDWPRLKQEALEHLEVAVQLRPDWDRPRAEIGIVLDNTGESDRAREYLEDAARHVEMNEHLAFCTGVTQWRTGHLQDALRSFETVLGYEPEHAEATDFAAYCCFQLGDDLRGRKLAKRSAELGCDRCYRWWKAGEFKR
jgi:tetratricopeptide (TPR) repeat protein